MRKITYANATAFHQELKERVAEYFSTTGIRRKAPNRMYIKSAMIITWYVVSWVLLVFFAQTWWQIGLLAGSVALAAAGVGFNVMHDASHGSYSDSKVVTRIMAFTLDLVGGSSYMWKWKHNVLHHTFTNVEGHDDDINMGGLARLAPSQGYRFFYRLQHYYVWFLYGFIALKWHLFDDFKEFVRGHVGPRKVPRPSGLEFFLFFGGKVIYIGAMVVVPLLLHPAVIVLPVYILASGFLGVVLAITFQLAHCVEEAQFPLPAEDTGMVEGEWAANQVMTTVDFAPRNPILTWYLGGLNFQIEHHLFPQTSHLHYPAIAPIVKEVCDKYNVRYSSHRTFRSALASHFRWLKAMSRRDFVPAAA